MLNRIVFVAGMVVLGAALATSQPAWQNPGTSGPPVCSPFHDQYAGSSAWYCYYNGSFPWFDAGQGWITMLRVAAPASGAIQVTYNFFEQSADGTIQPANMDYMQYGDTSPTTSSQAVFVLNPTQPSEVTLLGRHVDAGGVVEAKGSVGVIVSCPNIATCTAVTPQLIYTYLPVLPWYLSGTLTSDTSLPSQPNILAWSAVGVNDPQNDAQKNQFMTFAILNNSGANQVYTVTAYDKTGAVVGSKTTENVVAGQSIAKVLNNEWMTGLPAGLLKLRVSGAGTSIATFLQFSGPAATALVPVAETPAP